MAANILSTDETVESPILGPNITVEDIKCWISDAELLETGALSTSDVDHCTITIHGQFSSNSTEIEDDITEIS